MNISDLLYYSIYSLLVTVLRIIFFLDILGGGGVP